MKFFIAKNTILIILLSAFALLKCSSYAEDSGKKNINLSRSKRSVVTCADAKRVCNGNDTCRVVLKRIKRNCKFIKHKCLTSKSQGQQRNSHKNFEDKPSKDDLSHSKNLCTSNIDELKQFDIFQKPCKCARTGSSSRGLRRRKCENTRNLVYANPCYVKKFDMSFLYPGFQVDDDGNYFETSHIRNEFQLPNANPMSKSSNTGNDHSKTQDTSTTKMQFETQPSNEKEKNNNEFSEKSTTIQQITQQHNSSSKVQTTKKTESSPNDCKSNSHHEDILITAFLISGAALLLFLLLGVVVCFKKWKDHKRSEDIKEKTDQPDVIVRLTSGDSQPTFQKVSNRV